MEVMLAEFQKELPGMCTWAVQGCLDWQRFGIGEPSEIRVATAGYRDEMDVLGDFLSECCVLQPDAKVSSHQIYAEYRRWATDAGEQVIAQKRFSQSLEHRGSQMGFRKQHTNVGKIWTGLKLDTAVVAKDEVDG